MVPDAEQRQDELEDLKLFSHREHRDHRDIHAEN
jgi:hypothetical protein